MNDNNSSYLENERNSNDMSIRCAICGSKNVVKEFKKEGYDVKKGVVGTVLVGAPGALAGAGGKEVTYYHCADCGQVMNRPMYQVESDWIDELIADPTLFTTTLREKKAQYKNIEWEENAIQEDLCAQSTEEISIEEWKKEIIKKLEETPYINCRTLNRLDNDLKSFQACKELEKNGRIVAEMINDELHYRLVIDREEMRELFFKEHTFEKIKAMVDENFETYRKMLYEKLMFDKRYTQEEYEALIREVYNSEFEFEKPYVFEGFMAAFDIRMIEERHRIREKGGYRFKLEEKILDEEKQEREKEEKKKEKELQERTRKENMSDEDIAQVILDFLSENQDYFAAAEIVRKEDKLSECRMQRIVPILKRLEKEGYIKVKEEGGRTRYAIEKVGINLQEEEQKRIEEEKKREEQRRIQRENINQQIIEEEEKYNKELEVLQEKLTEFEAIFEANKSKIFGEGAKIKKEAKRQMEIYTDQIAKLKQDYLNKKSSLQAELQKL